MHGVVTYLLECLCDKIIQKPAWYFEFVENFGMKAEGEVFNHLDMILREESLVLKQFGVDVREFANQLVGKLKKKVGMA